MDNQFNMQNGNGQTEQKPDNFLLWSILSTVLCCLPLGIVAIIYANKVDTLWATGDKAGAIDAAKKAKIFTFISLGCGIVSFIVAFFLGILGAIFG